MEFSGFWMVEHAFVLGVVVNDELPMMAKTIVLQANWLREDDRRQLTDQQPADQQRRSGEVASFS